MLTKLSWVFALGFFISTLVSQSIMDLFSSFVIGLVIFVSIKEKSNPFKALDKKFWIFFFAWFAWVGLGLAINEVELKTTLLKLLEFKWVLTLVCLAILLKRILDAGKNSIFEIKDFEKFLNIFTWAFALTSLFAVAVYFLGFNPAHPGKVLDSFPDGTLRTGGFLDQPIVFGHLQTIFLSLLTAMLVLNFSNLKNKLFLMSAVGIGFLALVLSFTRGAWIGYLAALGVIFWFKSKRAFLASGILGVLIVLLSYAVWPDFKTRIDYAFQGGDSERVYIWKANLLMFADHPIFGVGYGQNKNHMIEYYAKAGAPEGLLISHAHNQYLHFLAGTGFLGILFYLGFLYFWLSMAFKNANQLKQKSQYFFAIAVGLLASVISVVFGGLTEANFEHSKMVYAMVCVWSLLLFLNATSKENRGEK